MADGAECHNYCWHANVVAWLQYVGYVFLCSISRLPVLAVLVAVGMDIGWLCLQRCGPIMKGSVHVCPVLGRLVS